MTYYTGQCPVSAPTIVSSSSSVDVCSQMSSGLTRRQISQSSLSLTCINDNIYLRWNGSIWTSQLIVSTDGESSPPQAISDGVILTENHYVNTTSTCFTSTVTVTGNLTALRALDGVTVICGDLDEAFDTSTIMIPSLSKYNNFIHAMYVFLMNFFLQLSQGLLL